MPKRPKTASTDPQPAPLTPLRREGRLARIAKALASGATVTDIAEAERICRGAASRLANSPECRHIIAEFVNAERDEMQALFYRSLRAIEQALGARREYFTKDGQVIYGGPDHYARLAAGKHLRYFMAAGRPAPKHPEKQDERKLTLDDIRRLVEAESSKSDFEVAA
jgi:hypothetical protein